MRLIIATRNESKLKEIKDILKDIKIPIISLLDLEKKIRIVENGKTFFENALKKTLCVSKLYPDDYVLGEDSGLEVDYLEGRPGIRSKRYSGKNSTSKKNNAKLLKNLDGVLIKDRGAHFFCCLTLAKSGRLIKVFEGRLRGRVSLREIGTNGFGYDPVLYLSTYKKTVAQLSLGLKNKISHRAKSFQKLAKYLRKLARKNI